MKDQKLALLNHLSKQANDRQSVTVFIDALLHHIGIDCSYHPRMMELREQVILAEMKWLSNSRSAAASHEVLAGIQTAIKTMQLESVFQVSEHGLMLTRRALSKEMPDFFSNPDINHSLRPAETVYLMYLLWINGSLGRVDDRDSWPHPASGGTTVIFNNRQSQFISKRNKIVNAKSESDLLNSVEQLVRSAGINR